MRTRNLIALLGGVAVALPLASRAQQKAMPVIGYLASTSPGPYLATYRQALSEIGYVEGQTVAIEYRFAEATLIGSPHWLPISSPAKST
jgi:putative ABC transport system substrate-binding protein